MLDITEKAQDMLNQYISQGEDTNLAVRIEIVGRGAKGFNYDLQLVPIKMLRMAMLKLNLMASNY
jgi:Fe-S cluster assembly iron-binding protein IscA